VDSDESKVNMEMYPVDYTISDLGGFLKDVEQGYY
jgi:hypothetical protein